MDATPFSAGVSPLDEAYGKRAEGDRDGALRLAMAVLEAEPEQLGAAALIAWVLAESERELVAGEAAARLVDGFIRRGDLPAAVVAAHIADRAGEDGGELRGRIAEAFGHGSDRLGDASPAPPPLPSKAEVAPRVARLKGDALLERAEEALQAFLRQDDSRPDDAELPELPLFSALEPAPLERLLSALEVREVPTGKAVVRQGEEGTEAYVLVRGVLEVARTSPGTSSMTLAALGPGAIFGEMALVSETPRAASVSAVEPALLLAISRDDLESLAGEQPAIGEQLGQFCHQRMVSNLIRHSPILAAVEPAARSELIDRFETATFEAGDVVLEKGAETEGLYLIASGGVEVVGRDSDGDRLRIAQLGPGEVVGEISLVLRRPASADVVALYPTVALRLTRDRFQQAIRDYPGLLNELYDVATKREEETRSVVAQEAVDVDDVVLV